jgi:hypothetical protein
MLLNEHLIPLKIGVFYIAPRKDIVGIKYADNRFKAAWQNLIYPSMNV